MYFMRVGIATPNFSPNILFDALGLRLLSPVDVSLRTCLSGCVLPSGGGPSSVQPIYVRRGTVVEARIGVMHRDKDYWGQDAEQFDPERWEGILPKWEYIPFLGGGRICPAPQITLTQYALIIIRFMQRFEVLENRDDQLEFIEDIKFGKQSKNGVQVAFYSPVERAVSSSID